MKITFFGAAQNVTGSKHLVQTENYNLLLDCGLYQGKRQDSNLQNSSLPFVASKIDAVILSHAHLDHCGTLPILVKNGFLSKIYCTKATAEIAKLILEDSASIQEQDAIYYNKHLQPGQKEITPIYTKDDVEKTVNCFECVEYFSQSGQWTQLSSNIRFKLYDAGHVLGSAIILLEVTENGVAKNLVFSGDLGRENMPILNSPEKIAENVNSLILECTYGDRNHKPISNLQGQLKDIIKQAVSKNGKIIIPAFSLERTQELIYTLHNLINKKIIPEINIYIDSPLADKITNVFANSKQYFDSDFWKDFGDKKRSPFFAKNIIYTKSIQESKAINDIKDSVIIIAGSGMAEGGRILHHLKKNIQNENNTILIVGYQAENTLGRKIQDKVTPVRIFGQFYDVLAKVVTLDELSAHADQTDLLNFVENAKGLTNLFLVHSEKNSLEVFGNIVKSKLPKIVVNMPVLGQSFDI